MFAWSPLVVLSWCGLTDTVAVLVNGNLLHFSPTQPQF